MADYETVFELFPFPEYPDGELSPATWNILGTQLGIFEREYPGRAKQEAARFSLTQPFEYYAGAITALQDVLELFKPVEADLRGIPWQTYQERVMAVILRKMALLEVVRDRESVFKGIR